MAAIRICSVEGCGKPVNARGYCRNHDHSWRKYQDPLFAARNHNPAKKFFEGLAAREPTDDCIIWPFSRSQNGYGVMWVETAMRTVSRLECMRAYGPPPDPKMDAAHSCGNGGLGCVNYRHLRWATRKENMKDKAVHGTEQRGERSGLSKLKEMDVRHIRILISRGLTCKEIGERFGVHRRTISDIKRAKTWGWFA